MTNVRIFKMTGGHEIICIVKDEEDSDSNFIEVEYPMIIKKMNVSKESFTFSFTDYSSYGSEEIVLINKFCIESLTINLSDSIKESYMKYVLLLDTEDVADDEEVTDDESIDEVIHVKLGNSIH